MAHHGWGWSGKGWNLIEGLRLDGLGWVIKLGGQNRRLLWCRWLNFDGIVIDHGFGGKGLFRDFTRFQIHRSSGYDHRWQILLAQITWRPGLGFHDGRLGGFSQWTTPRG